MRDCISTWLYFIMESDAAGTSTPSELLHAADQHIVEPWCIGYTAVASILVLSPEIFCTLWRAFWSVSIIAEISFQSLPRFFFLSFLHIISSIPSSEIGKWKKIRSSGLEDDS